MVTNWAHPSNDLGTDFDLYSSYSDMMYERNAWKYCNYDANVGSFRDCGPEAGVAVGGQVYIYKLE
jgi:hypothetical protein